MKTRHRIDPEILESVRQRTLAGDRQNEIAEALGVHRNSVYRYQRRLGLHAWQGITEEEEKTILSLLKAGRGTSWIGRELNVGEHQARLVAQKFGICRRVGEPGYRWKPTVRQFIDVMNLAFDGKDSAASIARKVAGPYKPVLKLVHKIRECERFLTTRTLDSDLPMKYRENKFGTAKHTQDDFERTLALVDYVNQKYFDGRLPQDQLVDALVNSALATFRQEWPAVSVTPMELERLTSHLAAHFRSAVSMLSTQNGWTN